jgi:hypothetical protein
MACFTLVEGGELGTFLFGGLCVCVCVCVGVCVYVLVGSSSSEGGMDMCYVHECVSVCVYIFPPISLDTTMYLCVCVRVCM